MALNLNQQQSYADNTQHIARMRSVIVQLAVSKASGTPTADEQTLIGKILVEPMKWATHWWLAALTDDSINEVAGSLTGVSETALTTIATAQWGAFVHAGKVN